MEEMETEFKFVNLDERQFGAYQKFKEEYLVDEFDTLDDPDAARDPQVVAAMMLAESDRD